MDKSTFNYFSKFCDSKAVGILFVGLLFTSEVALAKDNLCTYARVLPFFGDHHFLPNSSTSVENVHPQLETNATLFRRGRSGEIIKELADEVSVDLDRKVMKVRLNSSCHWSDGQRITASQMLAGIELNFVESNQALYLPGRSMLKNGAAIANGEAELTTLGVRVLDENTLEFDLIVPPRLLQLGLTYMTMTPAPLHLMDDNPSAWPTSSLVRVSSGPFRAISQKEDEIQLVRNEYYCEGLKSNINRINLYGREGRRNSPLMLLSGRIDIAEEVTSDQWEALNARGRGFRVEETEEEIMAFLMISDANPALKDNEIRKAIMLGINRDYLSSEVTGGSVESDVMNSISFSYSGYDQSALPQEILSPFEQRVQLARSIMEARGYTKQNPLQLTFGIRPSTPYEQMGFAIASMLRRINVDAKPMIVKKVGERVKNDLSVNAWGADFPDPSNTILGVVNHLSHDFVDRVEASNAIFDNPKRYAALREIAQEVIDSYQVLPLVQLKGRWVMSSEIELLEENYPIGRNVYRKSCDSPY